MTLAKVSRFRNRVEISMGDAGTIKVSPEVALALGNALLDCALDVKRTTFKYSEFDTRYIEIEE